MTRSKCVAGGVLGGLGVLAALLALVPPEDPPTSLHPYNPWWYRAYKRRQAGRPNWHPLNSAVPAPRRASAGSTR